MKENGGKMNTYFNEITAKPVNTVDGKVLYKIPAGAMCGCVLNTFLGTVYKLSILQTESQDKYVRTDPLLKGFT